MITITNKESNYLARVMQIDNVVEIPGARTLQKTIIDFQEVAISKDIKVGDIVVYFPAGAQIDHEYLSATNSFAKKELNSDPEVSGYFNSKGLVKAINLMKGQIKSCGYVVPAYSYFKEGYSVLYDKVTELKITIPSEFDTINGKVVVQKYEPPVRGGNINGNGKQSKQLSRLVDGQVHLHDDTKNLRRNMDRIDAKKDIVTLSYKMHGTSGWASNVLVKRPLGLIERLLRKVGVNISDTEYDVVYGSRRVVKNKGFDSKGQDHYFSYDLWGDVVDKNNLREILPKGYSIYYEIVGYTKDGGMIQKDYDYGCYKIPVIEMSGGKEVGRHMQSKLYVYRVTHTTPDGLVTNLSTQDALAFCDRLGLEHTPVKWSGTLNHAVRHLEDTHPDHWPDLDYSPENIIKLLETEYNDKDCYMCTNKVPEEGIVIRKEGDPFNWEAYKLKSFEFLKRETTELEKEVEA